MEKLLSLLAENPVDNELAATIFNQIADNRRDTRELITILLTRLAGKEWGSLEANRQIVREIRQLLMKNGLQVRTHSTPESGDLSHIEYSGNKHGLFTIVSADPKLRNIYASPKFPSLIAVEKDTEPSA